MHIKNRSKCLFTDIVHSEGHSGERQLLKQLVSDNKIVSVNSVDDYFFLQRIVCSDIVTALRRYHLTHD